MHWIAGPAEFTMTVRDVASATSPKVGEVTAAGR
jgi:hypothetical protein